MTRAGNSVMSRMHDGPVSAIVIASLALLRPDMGVDRISDDGIGAARLVLVDDRVALIVMAHPRH